MASEKKLKLELPVDSLATQLETACVLEAAARKPGNVHPQASFEDLEFENFLDAAKVTGRVMSQVNQLGLGQAVLETVLETRRLTGSNVNLGITLLLAPLAAVDASQSLADGIRSVLHGIDLYDTELVYTAIRCVCAGGLGEVPDQDISQRPKLPLLECMALAKHRDAIALQYCQHFEQILNDGRQVFLKWTQQGYDWETSIIGTQLEMMQRMPDSLIVRKCGIETAQDSALLAKRVLAAGWPNSSHGRMMLQDFDDWLRADGHRRNPGTTADMIAAVLFSAVRDRQWTPPSELWI